MTRQLAPIFTWRSAICDSDLDPAARHVALTLSLHMNERGNSAFPGAKTLSEETGLHISTVRAKLALLEQLGWLKCIERGGRRGESRRANHYQGVVPVAYADPSPETTRRADRADPSSSPRRPIVQDDPSSSCNSPLEIPPGGEVSPPTNIIDLVSPEPTSTDRLVAGYVVAYRDRHGGRDPSASWRGQAGKAVAAALAEGEDVDAIERCLGAIANEGKAPGVLNHVLSDYHRTVPA